MRGGGYVSNQNWMLSLQPDLEDAHNKLARLESMTVEPRLRLMACTNLRLVYTPGLSLCARKLSLLRCKEVLTEIEDSLKRELIS